MNDITFFNNTNKKIKEIKLLKGLIEYAVEKIKADNVIFSVIFVDNDEIRKLNKEYRKIDKETDVLSFAFEDNDAIKTKDVRLLGEIYISIDKANDQSVEYGHSLTRELSFLLIHGFLHLLGYDHMNKEDEDIMFKMQEEILYGYGVTK